MANRTSGSLIIFFPPLRRWFRSGAIIIAVALIVGINVPNSLSGKAAPDERLVEALQQPVEHTRAADHRALVEAAETTARKRQAENMETERKREVPVTKREAILKAWEAFLAAGRGKFNQNDAIRGDYDCLRRIRHDLSDPERRASENNAKRAEYEMFDEVADAFIVWLNDAKTLGKSDWTYGDLNDQTFGIIYLTQLFKELSNCLTPRDLWRENRFKKRID
jgi:hypothetical protein